MKNRGLDLVVKDDLAASFLYYSQVRGRTLRVAGGRGRQQMRREGEGGLGFADFPKTGCPGTGFKGGGGGGGGDQLFNFTSKRRWNGIGKEGSGKGAGKGKIRPTYKFWKEVVPSSELRT